jgi:hypothetical protein
MSGFPIHNRSRRSCSLFFHIALSLSDLRAEGLAIVEQLLVDDYESENVRVFWSGGNPFAGVRNGFFQLRR